MPPSPLKRISHLFVDRVVSKQYVGPWVVSSTVRWGLPARCNYLTQRCNDTTMRGNVTKHSP